MIPSTPASAAHSSSKPVAEILTAIKFSTHPCALVSIPQIDRCTAGHWPDQTSHPLLLLEDHASSAKWTALTGRPLTSVGVSFYFGASAGASNQSPIRRSTKPPPGVQTVQNPRRSNRFNCTLIFTKPRLSRLYLYGITRPLKPC
jgi:hypothetical protein